MAGTREADCLCLVPMQPTEDGILWHATKLRTKTCLHLDTVVVVMLMVCHMCLCLPHRHALGVSWISQAMRCSVHRFLNALWAAAGSECITLLTNAEGLFLFS